MHKECKYIILSLLLALTMPIMAQDQPDGSSCDNAIEVQQGLNNVPFEPGTYYFTAWSYDLPMDIVYVPKVFDKNKAPEGFLDFVCPFSDEGGVYDDDIADVYSKEGGYIVMPKTLIFKPTKTKEGKDAWHFEVTAAERDRISEYGVLRDVQAYVKVVIKDEGGVDAHPDTVSRRCLDSCRYIQLGDTLHVEANDSESVYVFSFNRWTSDSIRFVWKGETESATLWLGRQNCEFRPEATDPNYIIHYDIPAIGEYKFTMDDVKKMVDTNGGVFYGKVLSKQGGDFIIERVPEVIIPGIRLEYDSVVPVRRQDDTLYFFSKKWEATHFECPTANRVKVYFGLSEDMDTVSNYVASYYMDLDLANHRYLNLSKTEMAELTDKLKEEDNYIFMIVVASAPTTIMAKAWDEDTDCFGKSKLIRSGEPFTITSYTPLNKAIYRMKYSDWKGYQITIEGQSSIPYIAGMTNYCELTSLGKNDASKCISGSFKNQTKKGKQTWTITKDVVDGWDGQEDENGYFYWHFSVVGASRTFTFTSSKPPLYDIVAWGEGGTVTGGGVYENGQSVTLKAEADECYTFVKWSDGVTTPERTIEVTGDATYQAEFELKTTTIIVSAGSTKGKVEIKKVE